MDPNLPSHLGQYDSTNPSKSLKDDFFQTSKTTRGKATHGGRRWLQNQNLHEIFLQLVDGFHVTHQVLVFRKPQLTMGAFKSLDTLQKDRKCEMIRHSPVERYETTQVCKTGIIPFQIGV